MSSSTESRPWDVTIVGAGVIGLSLAFELARRHRRVLLLDRRTPGSGASQAAAGMLAPVSEAENEQPELVRFSLDSIARYPSWIESVQTASGMECGYRPEGTLWVAPHRDAWADLERLESLLHRKGLGCRRLSTREVGRREPHLSGRVLGGLYVEQDVQLDPRRLIACLKRAAETLGVEIRADVEVDRVQANEFSGHLPDGTKLSGKSGAVVLAAGAWSTHQGLVPARPAVRPVKGQLLRLRGEVLLRHVVRAPDVYLVPRENGELLVGGTMEEMGFDEAPTAGAAMDLLRRAWELLPGIYELVLEEQAVGLRPATEDQLPRITALGGNGPFVSMGHFRHGILLAPASAHYLAEWIVEGREPDALRPFRLEGEDAFQSEVVTVRQVRD